MCGSLLLKKRLDTPCIMNIEAFLDHTIELMNIAFKKLENPILPISTPLESRLISTDNNTLLKVKKRRGSKNGMAIYIHKGRRKKKM